jgi:protein TonB
LPDLQQMTPPDIKPETALASSQRPDRKPARPEPQPVRQEPARQKAAPTRTAEPARAQPATPQRAGQGGESRASRQGGGGGGVSAQTRASLTQQWGAQITQRIARQMSRVSAARGKSANIQLVIARNGRIQSISVLSSTGNARVDQDILRAAQSTRSIPAAPAGLTDPTYQFSQAFRIP